MPARRHAEIRALFFELMDLPPEARPARLEALAPDDWLRGEVLSLLANADQPLFDARAATAPPEEVGPEDPLGWIGQTVDGRYRIEALVAEGGAGLVYRAHNVRWQRPVAVKAFKAQLDLLGREEVRSAFIKEGAILNELSRRTTAIVQSYDVGTWPSADGREVDFTVLEWLEGETMAEALARRGPAPLAEAMALLSPVAAALAVAHQHGIAHRDIKPRNIFLAREGEVAVAKLLDFGAAKSAADRQRGFQSTGRKVSAFTPGYAAPEQLTLTLGASGPWTDVYGLAVVLVEMLLGRSPFSGLDVLEAMRRTSDPARRPTPRSFGVELPEAVEQVFVRSLAVKPAERPQDAGAFWRALEEAAQAEAPPGRVGLLRRLGLRR